MVPDLLQIAYGPSGWGTSGYSSGTGEITVWTLSVREKSSNKVPKSSTRWILGISGAVVAVMGAAFAWYKADGCGLKCGGPEGDFV